MSTRRRTPNLKKKLQKGKSKENLTTGELKSLYRDLKKQRAALDKEIEELKAQGATEDLKPEMNALHDYNDIKDVTQSVLGHLANIEGCTIADLHKRYNLPLE